MLLKASLLQLARGDRQHSLLLLFLSALLLADPAPAAGAETRDLRARLTQHASLDPREAYLYRKQVLKTSDPVTAAALGAERRPKQINGNFRPVGIPEGITESADPTRPIPIAGPGGGFVYRWDASGEDGFEAPSLDAILRGGDTNRRRIKMEIYYPDGKTVTGGSFHRGSHVWDKLVTKWRLRDFRDYRLPEGHEESAAPLRAEGKLEATDPTRARDLYGNLVDYVLVGYAGMMEQPFTLEGARELGIRARRPMVEAYNYTRSRHGFSLTMENGRETWRSHGSLAHNRPKACAEPAREGEWLSENHQHGYGGRPLMDDDGYVLLHDGTPWMIYERVTEMNEWRDDQGRRHTLPWRTEVVARRMKTPYEFFRPGERTWNGRDGAAEVLIASVNNKNGVPYPATDRHGMGYLFEGFNIAGHPVKIDGEAYWVGTGSPGNYVEDYGVVLGYRREAEGPIGRYTLSTDSHGDLANAARGFAEHYGLSWTGRADLFFDDRQKPWAILHGVDVDNLPAGFPRTGWPRPEQFEYYFRNQFVVPVSFVKKNGQPALEFLDPFAPERAVPTAPAPSAALPVASVS